MHQRLSGRGMSQREYERYAGMVWTYAVGIMTGLVMAAWM